VRNRSNRLAVTLAAVAVLAGALLTSLLTLPLLSRSVVTFALAASAGWAVVFAGAALLARSVQRSERPAEGGEDAPLADASAPPSVAEG
jgi:hypothetical protein